MLSLIHTSGLFCANIPTNCSAFGSQPLANSPEPSSCALSATWRDGNSQQAGKKSYSAERSKKARPQCRRSTRKADPASWSQDRGRLLNNRRHLHQVTSNITVFIRSIFGNVLAVKLIPANQITVPMWHHHWVGEKHCQMVHREGWGDLKNYVTTRALEHFVKPRNTPKVKLLAGILKDSFACSGLAYLSNHPVLQVLFPALLPTKVSVVLVFPTAQYCTFIFTFVHKYVCLFSLFKLLSIYLPHHHPQLTDSTSLIFGATKATVLKLKPGSLV